MKECLPHLLIRVFVVPSRIVKRAKQFIPPTLFSTALHQLGEEDPYRVVVGNRKPMRMLSHDCTSILQIVFVLASPISHLLSPPAQKEERAIASEAEATQTYASYTR
jgi:hypothetical protein